MDLFNTKKITALIAKVDEMQEQLENFMSGTNKSLETHDSQLEHCASNDDLGALENRFEELENDVPTSSEVDDISNSVDSVDCKLNTFIDFLVTNGVLTKEQEKEFHKEFDDTNR